MIKNKVLTIFICLALLPAFAFAQNKQTTPEKKPNIVHCETLDDIENAKKQGADYIEKSGYYFFRKGSEYKGPFLKFETAQKLRKSYLEAAQKQGFITDSNYPGVFNPRLIIDPFVSFNKEKQLLFELPEGKTVKASSVMIHAEPYLFNSVSFGKISMAKMGDYFAITGQIEKKEKIKINPKTLTYVIGASILGKDGNVLWKNYGTVGDDMGFKCIAPLPHTTIQPQYLMIFTVGKGKLKQMLTAEDDIPPVDATPFDYHILCSAVLEVGPDWYPPIEQETEKEYKRMMEDDSKNKIEKIKELGKPNKSVSKK